MPKYKDMIEEFKYAYVRHIATERALEFKWVIRRPTPNKAALVAKLRPSGYGAQNDGSNFHLRMGMDLVNEPFTDEVRLGYLGAGEIMKIAKLKEQIERWVLGTRDELPTQAEVDEL